MNRRRSICIVSAALVAGALAATPAQAQAKASAKPAAKAAAKAVITPTPSSSYANYVLWDMNEPFGATTMLDSGPQGINGNIGSEVITGEEFSDAVGYKFLRLKPNTPPAHPEHLVTIPDNDAIDPDAGPYAVEIRYKTTNAFGNLIQKGQSHTAGGQFKIQLPGGRVQCYYKGSNGRVGVGYKTPINDGTWHTVRCELGATAVTLFIDGVKVARHVGSPGIVNNSFPLTIGGKPACDQIKVTCDYFGGVVDYVRIDKG